MDQRTGRGAARGVALFFGALVVLSAVSPLAAAPVLAADVFVQAKPSTPAGRYVAAEAATSFTSEVSGFTTTGAVWQSNTDGTWRDIVPTASVSLTSSGSYTSTLAIARATASLDGARYRVRFVGLGANYSDYSDPALLRVVSIASVSPREGTAGTGEFTITGSGFSDGTLVRFPALPGTWTSATSIRVDSSTSISARVPADASTGSTSVQIVSFGLTESTAFTVTPAAVAPTVAITATKLDLSAGDSTVLTAVPTGTPTPTVAWQSSTDGSDWRATGASGDTLTLTVSSGDDGRSYRAKATNGTLPDGISNVIPLRILSAGAVSSGRVGETVSITGTGFTAPMQVRFTGSDWTSATVLSRTGLSVRIPGDAMAGSIAVRSGALEVTGPALALAGPQVTLNPSPSALTLAAGATASFSVDATGWTTVRWESSTGSGWTTIEGETGTTYTRSTSPADDGRAIRAVFSSNGGTAPTTATRLRIVSIASFSPAASLVGDTVTIAGTGLGPDAAVRFGDGDTTTATASGAAWSVRVPSSATSGPITITVGSVEVASSTSFTVGRRPTVTIAAVPTAVPTDEIALTMTVTDHTSATWSRLTAGGWTTVSTGTTYGFTATAADDGARFRATAWNEFGEATQETTITVLSVSSIDPTTATPGTTVTITGTGFTGATIAVTIGDELTSATVVDRTTATFLAPDGAGQLSVTIGGTTVPGPTFTAAAPTDGGGSDSSGDTSTSTGDGTTNPQDPQTPSNPGNPQVPAGPGIPLAPMAGVLGATSDPGALGLPATGQAGRTIPLAPRSSSGSPLAYRSETGRVCIVMGSTLWLIGVGTCTVAASPVADGAGTATPTRVSIAVNPSTPVLTQRIVAGRAQATKGTITVRRGTVVTSRLKTPLTLVGAQVELWFRGAGTGWTKIATTRVAGAGEASYRIPRAAARTGTFQWRFRGSATYLAAQSATIGLRAR